MAFYTFFILRRKTMTKAEIELLDKAALVAFGVYLKRELKEPDP